MDEINCIFCGIESSNVVIEENGFKGRKCPKCGLIYISPRPSRDEVHDLYGHDDAQIPAAVHIGGDFGKRLDARHHLKLIRRFIGSGSLLEVGAGAGYFLDEARNLGFVPFAIEFNPIQANHIRERLKIPCAESPLDPSLFDGRTFDVIYHCDVVSHFFDPIGDFRSMYALLNDDGLLVFETGNFGDMSQRYFHHIRRFQYPDHLFFFSSENLRTLLDQTGFHVECIYRYSILPQKRFINAVAFLKNLISRPSRSSALDVPPVTAHRAEGAGPSSSARGAGALKWLRNAYIYLGYLLRYVVGRFVVRPDEPQTVLVIARKRRGLIGTG